MHSYSVWFTGLYRVGISGIILEVMDNDIDVVCNGKSLHKDLIVEYKA